MKIYKTNNPQDFTVLASEFSEERLIIDIADIACVWTGQLNTYSPEVVRKHDFVVGQGEYLGGTIVNFPGDLSLCLVTWGNSMPTFGEDCVNIILSMIEGIKNGNDILVNDKKVASWARATTGSGWVQTVVHFSINIDKDLIKEICIKPMKKIPGQLSDYNIEATDILNKLNIEELLKQYQKE